MLHPTAHQLRFEWGAEGVRRLAPLSGVVVIVDILRFTTCVEVAVSGGAGVFPYRYRDDSAGAFAESAGAVLAGERGRTPSLSPHSLRSLPAGSRLVLPSPNGSACTVIAGESKIPTLAACLRNAAAVAGFINDHHPGAVVGVIACGELWPGGALRPAIEDLIGAGAVWGGLDQASLSPEARLAVSACRSAEADLPSVLRDCASGRELIDKGFPEDLAMTAELNVSDAVPAYVDGAYRALRAAGAPGSSPPAPA